MQAQIAIRRGNKDQARSLLKAVISQDPNNEEALMLYAGIAEKREYAILCVKKVLQLNPNNHTARQWLEKLNTESIQPSQSSKQASPPPKPSKLNSALVILTTGFLVTAMASCAFGVIIGANMFPRDAKRSTAGVPISQVAVTAVTQIVGDSPVTQIAVTAITQVAGPTYIPQPTYTPQPTPAPIEILVTATFPPDFTEIRRFEGNGRTSTDLFSLPAGTIKVRWDYDGESNFILHIKRLDNDVDVSLENAIGAAHGQNIFKVGNSDQYLFTVVSSGAWTIVVEFKP